MRQTGHTVNNNKRFTLGLVAASLFIGCSPYAAYAAAPGAGAPGGDGPIDIQANEQEFSGDTVIAKGNVRVIYKDSVVYAPQATLFRTPDGQPQKAIFTGHPRLLQGPNRMDADTLVFEIAKQAVIADGHAHSEVVCDGSDSEKNKGAAGALSTPQAPTNVALTNDPVAAPKTASAAAPKKAPKKGKNGQPFEWPMAGQEEPVADDTANSALTASISRANNDSDLPAKVKNTGKATKAQVPEHILTDADHQEYVRDGGKFEATGHVHVKHGDIVVKADKLQLVYGVDNKPETALFSGDVDATQFDNHTIADSMTYFLSTQRLQAMGHVKSKVIQRANKDDLKKGGLTGQKDPNAANAAELGDMPDDQTIMITSDAQDYTKDTGRISADGNVHVKYGDTTGIGPKVVVLRNEEGQAEKVLFTGRSQISQPGKRWIGDRIAFTVADRRVLAEGNTRAIILQQQKPGAVPSTSPSMGGAKLAQQKPTVTASKPAVISSRKDEVTQ